MTHNDEFQKAFTMPVGGWHGSYLVWRPGAHPAKLHRRTKAFRKLVVLRTALSIGLLIVLGCLLAAIRLATTSVPKGIGLGVVTLILSCWLWLIIAESGGGYNEVVRGLHCSSLSLIPRTQLYWPSSKLERDLASSLEKIQASQAVIVGVVSRQQVSELHENAWTLLTSQQVTQGDLATLKQTEAEIAKIDRLLAEQKSKSTHDQAREAGTALQDQGEAIADQLRLFREFLKNENDKQ